MRFTLLLIAIACSAISIAQRPAPDTLITAKGPLVIQPIYHASVVLSWNNQVIYIDPYGGANAYKLTFPMEAKRE